MNFKLHASSISNGLCALDLASCNVDASAEMPDHMSAGFAEYVAGLRNTMQVVDGVAFINVSGVLGEQLDNFDVFFGMADYMDIRQMIHAANVDPSVSAIVMPISSPGGYLTGMEETAAAMMASEKPLVTFTSTMAASAGYALALAGDAFYASPSAIVASVGVYSLFYDWSAAFEQMGIKAELFASGTFKGMGAQGVALTDAQREKMQADVDELADEFKAFVTERRGSVDDEHMEGQGIRAKRAAVAGMVDRIGTIEDAIEEAKDAASVR